MLVVSSAISRLGSLADAIISDKKYLGRVWIYWGYKKIFSCQWKMNYLTEYGHMISFASSPPGGIVSQQ